MSAINKNLLRLCSRGQKTPTHADVLRKLAEIRADGVVLMKFKTINENYQESECGNYRISKAKDSAVRDGVIFTLARVNKNNPAGAKMIAQEHCNNVASERAQAVKDLQALAGGL